MNFPRWRSSFAFLLLIVLLAPILAACGGTAATPEQTTAAPADTGGAAATTAPDTGAAEATTAPEAVATTAPEAEATADTSAEATADTSAEATADTGAAPGGGDSAASENVLRIYQPTFPEVIDPQQASFSHEIAVMAMNWEGLTKLNEKLESVPAAAEKWEFNETGDEITFTLRDDLKYSDGSPLTAENFRYAVERTCDPKVAGEYQSILFDIVGCSDFASTPVTDTAKYDQTRQALGVTASEDGKTLTVKLGAPAPYFPYIAGLWVFYPAKKELVEAGGETWTGDPKNLIGNGPFQITAIDENQQMTFAPNENYWGGRPKAGGLEYIYQPDLTVALQAYKSGQLDIVQPDPSELVAIQGDPELSQQLQMFASASTTNLQYNLTKEPFTDPKVRQAFSYAFDRKTYCEQIRNGDCLATETWIPEGIPGAIKTDKYGFDPEAAKKALAESTYGSADKLPEITLAYNTSNPNNQARHEWMAGQFRDILGVEIKLEPMENQALVAARKSSETFPQMTLAGWIQDYPDPQNWLSVFWGCKTTFAERAGYCNPKLDEVMKQADTEVKDPAKRMKLYEQAGEILVDDVPGPFIYHEANLFLVKPEVTGYEKTPADNEWPGQWASPLTITVTR